MYDFSVGYSNDRVVSVRGNSESDAMSRAGQRFGGSPIWAQRQMNLGEF